MTSLPFAKDLTPEGRFTALFVGPKHSGKTVAACSWLSPEPSKTRMKVLDTDGGIRGILSAPWIQKDRIDYDYFPPKTPGQNKPFFERVDDDLEVLMMTQKSGQTNYETYVCDSITSLCRNFILDSIPLTHAGNKGKSIGSMNLAGPSDYNFEAHGVDSYLMFLRSFNMNIIVTAHVIDRFDKPRLPSGEKDQYAESIVVGEKLSIRDKIGQNITPSFNHIFRFDREVIGGQEKFFVEYINSDIACTRFPGFKPGKHDITGKDFRSYTLGLVQKGTVSGAEQVKPDVLRTTS